MSKKTQSSLDSFLGIKSNKPKMKQTKLSFAGANKKKEPEKPKPTETSKKTKDPQPVVTSETSTREEEKENHHNSKDTKRADAEMKDDDDEPMEEKSSPKRSRRNASTDKKQKTANALSKLKRRKLEDSSALKEDDEDDDEGEEVSMEEESEDEEFFDDDNDEDEELEEEEEMEDDDFEEDVKTEEPKKKNPVEKNTKDKKEAIDSNPKEKRPLASALKQPPKSTKSSTNKKKSELVAQGMRTNEELKEEITWKEKVSYGALCETFEKIEEITGRLEIQQLLTELFRRVILNNPKDLYDLIYLASNSVAPAYECIELGIGDAILIKAIGEAYGTSPAMIKQKYEAEGDLGTVAKVSKGKQRTLGFGAKPKQLLAKEVHATFRQIAETTGSQSQKWKVEKIKGLLVRAQGAEAKYIIRGLQGKLRIGLAQSTVLISLSHALALSPPEGIKDDDEGETTEYPEEAKAYANTRSSLDKRLEAAAAIVKKAYSEVPSYDSILDAALSVQLQQMHKVCALTPGIPVTPMLAKPTKSIQEVLKRLSGQRFTCEFKYDGERAQVHMISDGTTKVFSRNLLNTSEKFPEVPLYVKEACADTGVKSFVLDTEVVAYNRETKQFVPFQVLSTRKKTEESAETAKVQVIVQAFDLMYINGKSLLNSTLSERRELLRKHFKPIDGKFQFATSVDHTEDGDTAVLEEFLETAVKSQCEGLMVKTLDANAAYEPSRRSLNWLKLKKDYLQGLGDSVDLVPLGAYHGKGKRTGFYGAYLLACYDEDTEEFQSVCKIGTGFSEEDLKNLSESFKDHIIPEKSSQYNVADTLECDVWFDAVQVWEVKAADLSKSSTHRGAVGRTGESDRGIGLRFPRFERVRPDKKPDEATSSEQILEMYYNQDSIVSEEGAANDDDDGI